MPPPLPPRPKKVWTKEDVAHNAEDAERCEVRGAAEKDLIKKIRQYDQCRFLFTNAMYGSKQLSLTADVLKYTAAMKRVSDVLTSLGVTGTDRKTAANEAVDKIRSNAEEAAKAARAERLKVTEDAALLVEAPSEPTIPKSYPPFPGGKGKDKEVKDMAEELVDSKQLLPVKPVMVPWNSAYAFKYQAASLRAPPDKEMYSYLENAGLGQHLVPALKSVYSNGTIRGLSQRLREQLILEKVANQCLVHDTKFMQALSRLFFFDRERLQAEILEDGDKPLDPEMHSLRFLNAKAWAGFPYACEQANGTMPLVSGFTRLPRDWWREPTVNKQGVKGVPLLPEEGTLGILEHAFGDANMLRDELKVGKTWAEVEQLWQARVSKTPMFNTFLLKRKFEAGEREEFEDKTRPYGCQPLGTRLLGKYAVHPFENALVSFLEHPDSISAYKYSPFYGGASKLVDHFRKKKSLGGITRLSGISYGDDQLYMFAYPNGEIVFWGPDVRAMDMNTSGVQAQNIMSYIQTHYGELKAERRNLFYLNAHVAFQHSLHLGSTFVCRKTNSLISGVAGTTLINIHTSAGIRVVMDRCMTGMDPLIRDDPKRYQEMFFLLEQAVFEAYRYRFKTDPTLKNVQVLTKFDDIDEHGITVPFLAQVIQPVVGRAKRFISVPADFDKFSISLVVSGATKKTNVLRLCIILGVYFTGAWASEVWASVLHKAYSHFLAAGGVDKEGLVDTEGMEDALAYFVGELGVTYGMGLPPYHYMVDFNDLDHEAFRAKYPHGWKEVVKAEVLATATPVDGGGVSTSSSTALGATKNAEVSLAPSSLPRTSSAGRALVVPPRPKPVFIPSSKDEVGLDPDNVLGAPPPIPPYVPVGLIFPTKPPPVPPFSRVSEVITKLKEAVKPADVKKGLTLLHKKIRDRTLAVACNREVQNKVDQVPGPPDGLVPLERSDLPITRDNSKITKSLHIDQIVDPMDAGNPTGRSVLEKREKYLRYLRRRRERNALRDQRREALRALADSMGTDQRAAVHAIVDQMQADDGDEQEEEDPRDQARREVQEENDDEDNEFDDEAAIRLRDEKERAAEREEADRDFFLNSSQAQAINYSGE